MSGTTGTCVDMDPASRTVSFNSFHLELKCESIIIVKSDSDSTRRFVRASVSRVRAHVGLKNLALNITAKDALWKSFIEFRVSESSVEKMR